MNEKVRLSEIAGRNQIHVLLIDDQKMVAMAVENLFKKETDLVFHYCLNPDEALATALKINPNVILQDINLPGDLDGFDLMAQYRRTPLLAKMPVIMLSAEEDPKIKASAFEKGANDYLIKIPDRVELIARVKHHAKSYALELERDLALEALQKSQSELIASNSRLAQKNIALQNFAHMVAHDLKNPLASVKGYLEYIFEAHADDLHAEVDDILGRIRQGTNSMADLVNKILAFSKSGAIQIRKEKCVLSELIREANIQLDWQIREKKATIVEHIEIESIQGDRRLLTQVFVNLISNALKYCPDTRTPHLQIRAKQVGDAIEIAFCDNGMGIPDHKFEAIFVEFQRVDEQSSVEGSGIGLSTCKKIIKSHGGQISVQSQVGQGSTFTIVLKSPAVDVKV